MSKDIENCLTIDVEDYFQVEAFSSIIAPEDWQKYPCRVKENVDNILNILNRLGVKATFFCLGWIAEHYPSVIRKIAEHGHEVASHGYAHRPIYKQTRAEFAQDIDRARKLLEDITGKQVLGYRAPTYSITIKTIWALDILIEQGYSYDSSIFPVHHDLYGIPDAPRFPFVIRKEQLEDIRLGKWPGNTLDFNSSLSTRSGAVADDDKIIEFPITSFRMGGVNLPVAGGGYFRLLPFWLTCRLLARINSDEGLPFVFYLHPWELDPEQPRISAPIKSRIRHYLNLKRTEARFNALVSRFSFAPMAKVLGFM